MALFARHISILLLLGLAYGAAASYTGFSTRTVSDNLGAVLFVICTAAVYMRVWIRAQDRDVRTSTLVTIGLAAPIGILLATALFGATERLFWVSDSVLTHAPSAKFFLSILRQEVPFDATAKEAIFKPGAITHGWVALWYMAFGISAVVETLSLLVLKALTLILVIWTGPLMWQWLGQERSERGRLIVLLYALAPSVLFHTMAFYKEAAVHLFVSGLMYGVLRSAVRPSWHAAVFVLLSVLGLVVERFYIAAVFLPVVAWAAWLSLRSRKLLPSALMAIAVAGVFYFRREAGGTISEAIEFIKNLRIHHASFQDVSHRYNYDIPYIVAVAKTIMTPIWAPDKLTMFKGVSSLITWGSFFHQLTMLTYLAALVHLMRTRRWFANLFLQIPFLLFVLVAAYVSPWAGRIRDSFYPFFVLYAGFYIAEYMKSDVAHLKAKLKRA